MVSVLLPIYATFVIYKDGGGGPEIPGGIGVEREGAYYV